MSGKLPVIAPNPFSPHTESADVFNFNSFFDTAESPIIIKPKAESSVYYILYILLKGRLLFYNSAFIN
jgi:hypothetical protein